MGWTVLYIAFGIVALWLLGEVLLQYKARLRWRLLAFAGFLGVVIGVLLPSVWVIGLGAMAFATGQTYVTLSFRRGFSTGWALGGSPGSSRRRRAGEEPPLSAEPNLEVSDLQAGPVPQERPEEFAGEVYQPQPLPDETGQYGIYDAAGYAAGQQAGYVGYDGNPGYADYGQGSTAAGQDGYGSGQETYAGVGSYDYGEGQYPAYSDPYIGTQQYDQYPDYGQQPYNPEQYPVDPYQAQQYSPDSPPGGVWVPQQRDGEQGSAAPPMPGEEPYPYPSGYETGYETGYESGYEAGGYETGYQSGYDGQYRY